MGVDGGGGGGGECGDPAALPQSSASSLAPPLLTPSAASAAAWQELSDVFAYAQIRCAGEDSGAVRALGAGLPLSDVPAVLRAAGYFPTAAQLAALGPGVAGGVVVHVDRSAQALPEAWPGLVR